MERSQQPQGQSNPSHLDNRRPYHAPDFKVLKINENTTGKNATTIEVSIGSGTAS